MNTPFYVGIVFSLFGIYILRDAIQKYKKSLASASWPSVDGKVVMLKLWGKRNINGEMKDAEKLVVDYEYQLKGSTYKSREVAFYTLMFPETIKFAQAHPIDSSIKVYYNPEKPNESILLPGPRVGNKRYSDLTLGIIGTLIGAAVSVSAWFGFIE